METIVSRKNWFRGQGVANRVPASALLVTNGKRCCLGFTAQQCGIADDDLKLADHNHGPYARIYAGSPQDVQGPARRLFPANFFAESDHADYNAEWIFRVMQINDSAHKTEASREAELITLFEANGHTIKLVD